MDWRDNQVGLGRPVEGGSIDAKGRSAAYVRITFGKSKDIFKDRALAVLVSPRRAYFVSGTGCSGENRWNVELSPHENAQMIVPGMLAGVLIVTERTPLAYFLGPVKDSLAKAMRES